MKEEIHPAPLSTKGKVMMLLIGLGLTGIWMLSIYAYFTLPSEIPTHFGFSGEPDGYGDKFMFLILPIVFSIAPIIFLLITKYRFTLINKYPYLINLPAFFIYIIKIKKERRGFWVNRYFEPLLGEGVFLAFFLLILEFGIYLGTISDKLPFWFIPFSLLMPILLILPPLIYIAKLSQEIETEAEYEEK